MMANILRRWLSQVMPPASPTRPRTFRPRLEILEERECPAVFNVPAGNVAMLIADLTIANSNNQADVINLTRSVYSITAANNNLGPNVGSSGLPIIGPDNSANPLAPANTLTINGNGATITRSATVLTNFRIVNVVGGRLFLNDVAITNGSTDTGFGGGIRVADPTGVNGTLDNLLLRNSLIAGNRSSGDGGGVGIVAGGKATIINTTVSGNTAANLGGGITQLNIAVGSTIVNSTVANNVANNTNAAAEVGGGINVEGGTMNLSNTLVAGNHRNSAAGPEDDLGSSQLSNAVPAPVINARNSLFQITPTGLGITGLNRANVIGLNPQLGPLQNNGGQTPTHAILTPTSPAVDAGDATLIPGADPVNNQPNNISDQRGPGFNRVINGQVDIGAYEFQPVAVAVGLGVSPATSVVGQPVTFTATVSGVAANSNIPQGTVTFIVDGMPIATITLVNGTASFTTAGLAVGNHTVQAVYNPALVGNYGFATGSSTAAIERVLAANVPPIGRRWRR